MFPHYLQAGSPRARLLLSYGEKLFQASLLFLSLLTSCVVLGRWTSISNFTWHSLWEPIWAPNSPFYKNTSHIGFRTTLL